MTPIFLTSQRLISAHWPAARPLLAPVVQAAQGEFEVDDLEDLCRDGRALSAVVMEGDEMVLAVVMEWRFYPRKTTLNIIAMGGRDARRAVGTFWSQFKAWALESGATHIEASTSAATARLLRPLGFEQTYHHLSAPCH